MSVIKNIGNREKFSGEASPPNILPIGREINFFIGLLPCSFSFHGEKENFNGRKFPKIQGLFTFKFTIVVEYFLAVYQKKSMSKCAPFRPSGVTILPPPEPSARNPCLSYSIFWCLNRHFRPKSGFSSLC